MSLVTPLFTASTKEICEEALSQGKLTSGICYIEQLNILAVIDSDKKIHYIDNIPYDSLSGAPIMNLTSNEESPINVSELGSGIYKINGQYIISGNLSTVNHSSTDTLFVVGHDESKSQTSIIKIIGKEIISYSIDSEGHYIADKFATEQFIERELEEFKLQHDTEINERIKNASDLAVKRVELSEDGKSINFYKDNSSSGSPEASYSVKFPDPVDITPKADKVLNGVSGNFAGINEEGNLTDSGKKASDFEASGSASKVKQELLSLIGQIPEDANVKTIIDYIQKNVSDSIAEIIADAPESFDTLKEMSDWISTHSNNAASMNTEIQNNKGSINELKTLIGQIPEGAVSNTVIEYITEVTQQAINNANLSQYAMATDLTDATDKLTALENKFNTTHAEFQVEIPVDGWSSTYPYTNTVNVEGVYANGQYAVIGAVHPNGGTEDQDKAIDKATACLMFNQDGVSDGSITFKAKKKPEITFTVIVYKLS